MPRRPLLALAPLGLSLLFAAPSVAGVIVVCGDGSGDTTTIQAAIDLAQSGDTIQVCAGTYHEAIDFKGKTLAIVAPQGPSQTILDATGLGTSVVSCVSFEGQGTLLEGFTLTGGSGTPSTTTPIDLYGGGLYARFSTLTVRHCVFNGNTADLGGGLLAFQCPSLVVEDCVFSGNGAKLGGGLFNNGSAVEVVHTTFEGNSAQITGGGMQTTQGSATLHECLFVNNQAGFDGGGMYNSLNASDVVECDFVQNQAGFDGGGLYNWSSTSLIDRCEFHQNHAGRGGGVLNFMASPTVSDSLFEGNTADEGAAVYSWNSDSSTTNTSLANNQAALAGGAIYASGGHARVQNSILWNNQAPIGPQIQLDPATPFDVDHSDVQGSGGSGPAWNPSFGQDLGGNLDADPLFADPAAGDFRLVAGSPCLDQGLNTLLPGKATLDLDGFVRFADASGAASGPPHVDLGAYEFGASPWTPLGGGLAGANGVPSLDGQGPLLPGSPVALSLTQAAPGAPAVLVVGLSSLNAPFLGGTLVPAPDLVPPPLPTDSQGSLLLAGVWPPSVPSGTTLYFQFWIADAAGPSGWAASPGLEGKAP